MLWGRGHRHQREAGPSQVPYERLFEPVRIGTLEVPNRIVMAPLYSNLGTESGAVTQRLIDYYAERAKGGVGLLVVESTCVDWPVGKNGPSPLTIHDQKMVRGLHDLTVAVHRHGAKIAVQLHHSGRQTSRWRATEGQPPVAPSPIPCKATGGDMPRELTREDIKALIAKYVQAAVHAQMAGFDAVELHGAHGYLINEFMSPLTNLRKDEYGGDFEGRLRFPVELVEGVKKALGQQFPVIIRLNGEDFAQGGLTIEDTVRIAQRLERAGGDAFHITSGIYESEPCWHYRIFPNPDVPEACNLAFADAVKRAVRAPVIAVGRLGRPEVAAQAIADGKADLVALGRPLLTDPEWPSKVKAGRLREVRPCLSCNEACIGNIGRLWAVSCVVNPQVGHERDFVVLPSPRAKRVLVVGGGPAGAEAARVAADRGHRVTLWEQSEQLGGQLRVAAAMKLNAPFLDYLRYLADELQRLKVDVRLRTTATARRVEDAAPDAVIVATGAEAAAPQLQPGQVIPSFTIPQLLKDATPDLGKRSTVIGGGSLGCKIAWQLAEQGVKVTLVEPGPSPTHGMSGVTAVYLRWQLEAHGVHVMTETRFSRLMPNGAEVIGGAGLATVVEADSAVVAGVYRPADRLYHELLGLVPGLYRVGDCLAPGSLGDAVASAFHTARHV